jgi:acyl-[acyl-carrier-protein]-phospholipid O-acyltransferase / long-chain-fatty-acid--[acyl-carrier-protein] ligase
MLKNFLYRLLTFLFKVEVKGLDNYTKAGDRVLIIANHTSFLDPLLLGVFLPDNVTFAIDTRIANLRRLRPFLKLAKIFEMDPTNPLSLKALINHLQEDNKAVVFPEGRITVTGSLMKIYDGTGMIADKSKATILPVRIEGAEYTYFSRLRNRVRLRLFPQISITILPPTNLDMPDNLTGKERRKYSGHVLADLMTEMFFASSHYRQTIFSALLGARKIYGGKHYVAEDLERKPLNYNALITRSIIIGNLLRSITAEHENIGVCLPNLTKTLNVILGLQIYNRTPAMLNYSTGSSGMISACQTAQIKTVLTSRRFIERAQLTESAERLGEHVNLIYLEDLAGEITLFSKIKGLYQSITAHYWYKRDKISPDTPAIILFTSGSEGSPKGVVLSHSNLLSNHKQLGSRISFNAQDIVLNVLPLFHSFGLATGTLFPVLNGIRTFLYPTPLHFSVIPEIAYEINATVMFSTNTFLAAYGEKAHAYDFYNIRYVFAGAEKLQENTRELWSSKFGLRILEGYGATETSPIATVNTPMECKPGTVGRFLPAMQHKLEDIPGIENAGKLHLSGPNIMLGYLLPDNPGKLVPPESIYGKGWYDTGDIVHIDEEGFASIRGRSKRFAKISGEMVSLTAVEQLASKAWPDAQHAVISIPEARKGEQLVLMTTQKGATTKQFADSSIGVGGLFFPKIILEVDLLPLLATGKTDYPAVTKQVLDKLSKP